MDNHLIAQIRVRAEDPHTRTDSFQSGQHPPHYPPIEEELLHNVEGRLGFALPEFLAQVYLKVGNGGFGPGYGLIGLPGGHTGDEGVSIDQMYESRRVSDPSDAAWNWPECVLPFCEWGCAIFTCIDCRSGVVSTFDPNSLRTGEATSRAFAATHRSVETWFADWVNGVRIWDTMFERDPDADGEFTNPFSGNRDVIRGRRLRRAFNPDH